MTTGIAAISRAVSTVGGVVPRTRVSEEAVATCRGKRIRGEGGGGVGRRTVEDGPSTVVTGRRGRLDVSGVA